MFKFLVNIALKKRKLIYILTSLITLFFLGITSNLKMSTDWKELLPLSNKIVKDYATVNDNFSNMTNVILLIKGKNHKSLGKAAEKIAAHLKIGLAPSEAEKKLLSEINLILNRDVEASAKIQQISNYIEQINPKNVIADDIKSISKKFEILFCRS